MADLPSMPNQIDMQGIDPFRRCHFCKKGMSYISTHFRAD